MHCRNCQRKVCLDHAVESKEYGVMTCSYCAIYSTNGLWRRVKPIPDNGSEEPKRKKRAA